jgi:hypothetical protein
MSKYLIAGYYNNAAGGAGTYAVPTVLVNGVAVAGAGWSAPEKVALVRCAFLSTVGTSGIINRNSHPQHVLTLPVLYDTGGDYEQHINFEDILDGKGVLVDKGETVNLQAVLTGNGVVYAFLEFDTSVTGVDASCLRVAGAQAMVAGIPVETGGNLRAAAFEPNTKYNLQAVYWLSTTAIRASVGLTSLKLVDCRAHTAVLLGHKMDVLTPSAKKLLSGQGSEWTSNALVFGSATAADAAATQAGYSSESTTSGR